MTEGILEEVTLRETLAEVLDQPSRKTARGKHPDRAQPEKKQGDTIGKGVRSTEMKAFFTHSYNISSH